MEAPRSHAIASTKAGLDEYDNSVQTASDEVSSIPYDNNICIASSEVVSNTASEERRAEILKQFATLLGTKSSSSNEQNSGIKDLIALLSKIVEDDDVVLTIPSLDLRLAEDDSGVLPDVGKHSILLGAESQGQSADRPVRPSMAASVLAMATEGKANVEQKAAQNIGKQTSWTKSTLRYASGAVGSNMSESLMQLINSRVRAWTLLLLRHSLSTSGDESRTRLLNMLSAKIKCVSSKTLFKTLPLPPSAAGKPKEADVVLPLLFEAYIDLSVQEKSETVLIRAPGTVSALFYGESDPHGLKKVMVRLDTGVVLSSLVDQARLVVLKAVASATQTPVHNQLQTPNTLPQIPESSVAQADRRRMTAYEDTISPVSSASLATLRSALNLSPSEAGQSPRLQKARSSALKLNSVLHGGCTVGRTPTSTGMRKVRSVKWEDPVQAPKLGPSLAPNPKKLRLVETACKLKSFKSFGRPHAGDFGSGPRNATFGAFGGSGNAGVWGRDGRLAHHPRPMFETAAQDEHIGMTGVADQNAKFDLLSSKQNTSKSLGAFSNVLRAQLTGSNPSENPKAMSQTSAPAPSLPRTATALEKSLMKNWT